MRLTRQVTRRAQVLAGAPLPVLYAPTATARDIRAVVRLADRRGDHQLRCAALLRMVQRGVANEREQRAARLLGAGAPAPAVGHCPPDPTDRGEPLTADAVGTRLTLRRPDAAAPVQVTVGERAEPLAYWRAAWAQLPPALADQLTTGVLTRLAVEHGITVVYAADPTSAPVARAVAAGLGARYGGQP